MLVKVFGSAISGITATTVCVEVSVDQGVGFFLVGLPDNAVKESSEHPILIDRYLTGKEVEVDAISDGKDVVLYPQLFHRQYYQ